MFLDPEKQKVIQDVFLVISIISLLLLLCLLFIPGLQEKTGEMAEYISLLLAVSIGLLAGSVIGNIISKKLEKNETPITTVILMYLGTTLALTITIMAAAKYFGIL